MISVVERLIESWLDNQTERRYQPAFIQLLISEGWSVLHNTRHSPIELGKDVIARNPEGILFCFQLKGNPGGRVTKNEAQKLLPQFIELLDLAPAKSFRKDISEKHVAVFVTNGDIDEEAQLLLNTAGERVLNPACPAMEYEIWARGKLIELFLKTARRIWPTDIEGTRHVLNLLARDGRECPDPNIISNIFNSVAPAPNKNISSSEKNSKLSALLLLSEIIKSPLYENENHYGLYFVSVLASVHALRYADNKKRLEAISRYADLGLEHAKDLLFDAKSRNFDPDYTWAERDVFSEAEIMLERRQLLGDCASTLVLSETSITFDRDYANKLIEISFFKPMIWGLAAIPAYIVRYWAVCRFRADVQADVQLGRILHTILVRNTDRNLRSLPAPYYSYTDCWAYENNLRFFANDNIFRDHFDGRIWFARIIFFMLAKRNYKQNCISLWDPFTRLIHEEPSLPSVAFFDSLHCDDGEMRTHIYHQKSWKDLVSEAIDDSDANFLDEFSSLSWLIAAYVAILPYRAWTGVMMRLDSTLNSTWYSREHQPSK